MMYDKVSSGYLLRDAYTTPKFAHSLAMSNTGADETPMLDLQSMDYCIKKRFYDIANTLVLDKLQLANSDVCAEIVRYCGAYVYYVDVDFGYRENNERFVTINFNDMSYEVPSDAVELPLEIPRLNPLSLAFYGMPQDGVQPLLPGFVLDNFSLRHSSLTLEDLELEGSTFNSLITPNMAKLKIVNSVVTPVPTLTQLIPKLTSTKDVGLDIQGMVISEAELVEFVESRTHMSFQTVDFYNVDPGLQVSAIEHVIEVILASFSSYRFYFCGSVDVLKMQVKELFGSGTHAHNKYASRYRFEETGSGFSFIFRG